MKPVYRVNDTDQLKQMEEVYKSLPKNIKDTVTEVYCNLVGTICINLNKFPKNLSKLEITHIVQKSKYCCFQTKNFSLFSDAKSEFSIII